MSRRKRNETHTMGQRHAHPHGSRKSEQLRRDTPVVFCWAAEPRDGQTVRTFRRCVYAERHDGKHSWEALDDAVSDALKAEAQSLIEEQRRFLPSQRLAYLQSKARDRRLI